MKVKWQGDRLALAVDRYNAMAKGLAETVPLVSAVLEGATVTQSKVDKRTRAKVDAIIREHMPADLWARCYLQTQYTYTLYLFAGFHAPEGDHTVDYADMSVAVARLDGTLWRSAPGKVPTPLTVGAMESAIKAAQDAKLVARVAQSAAVDEAMAAFPFVQ